MRFRLLQFLVPFGKRKSLYEKVGGETKIEELVDLLYEQVLADAELSRFFDDVCMHYQRYKLRVFLTMALGGPVRYKGQDLRGAHARLVENGLGDLHFDLLVRHLRTTLAVLELADQEVEDVVALVESTRNEVLGR